MTGASSWIYVTVWGQFRMGTLFLPTFYRVSVVARGLASGSTDIACCQMNYFLLSFMPFIVLNNQLTSVRQSETASVICLFCYLSDRCIYWFPYSTELKSACGPS